MIEITRGQYYDHETLDALLKQKQAFQAPKATSYFAARAGVRGEHIASAQWQACPNCKLIKCYTVTSYRTDMFRLCQYCGCCEVNMAWYSTTTRVLQEALARVYPVCQAALQITDKEIEEARRWWRKEKASGNIATNRELWLDAYGQAVRSKKANTNEMLEAYLGHKITGRFIGRID
jgi:hypothetical protein